MPQKKPETRRRIPFGIPDDVLEDFFNIGKIVGDQDAINIMMLAKNGISSPKEIIKILGIPQKRFYLRLKILIDYGILEKIEGKYILTKTGETLYKIVSILANFLVNRKNLEILERLEKTDLLPESDKNDLLQMLLPVEICNLLGLEHSFESFKIFYSFDKLSSYVIEELKRSEKRVLFATKYVNDLNVAETCLKVMDRGVEAFIIFESIKMPEVIKILPFLLSIKSINIVSQFMNKYFKNIRQVANLPFSFIIIDSKVLIFELPHPFKNEFLLAISIKGSKLIDKFNEFFFTFWKEGKEYSLV